MSHDGRAVANFVLDTCEAKGRPLTNLALQKIVYFCHVWSLIKLDRPLIRHQFEAWQFGPVLQYLYRDFKEFERDPISSRAKKLDPITGVSVVVEYSLDEPTEGLLREVVDFYSQLGAGELVRLSHAEGSPWDRAWNYDGKLNPGMKIENDAIRSYYSQMRGPFSLQ